MPDMFKGLAWFEALARGRMLTKALVYGGSESQTRTAGRVIPWKEF
jgi:hypothetical protein